MRTLNHKSVLLLVMACLSMSVWACTGGENAAGTGGGGGQQNASFSATVLDSNDNPVQGATVSLGRGVSDTTNSAGQASFSALDPSSDAVVTASAPGHMSRTETYPLTAGGSGSAQISLVAHDTTQTIDAGDGGQVSNSDGAEVDIPADGLVDANGDPISGDVDVSLTYLDVSNEEEREAAPGNWSARQMDGSDAQLESYGVIGVDIGDGSGGEADLASGETADITIPIPSNVQANAPQTMGLYNFDETTGEWVEEGQLTINQAGDAYTGNVDHFSSWNADKPMETVCYRVRLVDSNGDPISGGYIKSEGVDYNGSDAARTGQDGYAEVGARIGSQVEFSTESFGGYFGDFELQQTETRNTPGTASPECGPNSPTVTLTTTGTEGSDDGGNGDGDGDGNGDGGGNGGGGGDTSDIPGTYSMNSNYVDSFGCSANPNPPSLPTSMTITESSLPGGGGGIGSAFEEFYDITTNGQQGNGFLFLRQDSPDPGQPPQDDTTPSCSFDSDLQNTIQNNFSDTFTGQNPYFLSISLGIGAGSASTGTVISTPYSGSTDLDGLALHFEDLQSDCGCRHLYDWSASKQ